MGRRLELRFDRLDEVMPEVERLLKGHSASGAWSLGQILRHLSTALRLSINNDPASATLLADPDLARTFEVRRRRFFKTARLPEGGPVPDPVLIPPPGLEGEAEAEGLRSALREFEASAGSFRAHPYLGPLPKEEWAAFHAIHCAHHLRFARPID